MSSEHQPAKIVKTSNIGFILGILLVVALGMYFFKSGFMADKFGVSNKIETMPEATRVPLVEIEEEPITLLDDQEEWTSEDEGVKIVAEVPEISEIHKPVDTAIGDINPALIITMMLLGAGVALKVSNKLA